MHRTRRTGWLVFLSAVVLAAPAGELSFTGSLVRIGHESISVKLADRRVIDVRLADTSDLRWETIAANCHTGDQVRISGRTIRPVWEAETSHYQYLQLTGIELVRHTADDASPESLPFALRRDDADPTSTSVDQAHGDRAQEDELEHAREVNLMAAAHLPNFVADEKAVRYSSDSARPNWRHVDTVEAEVAFQGPRAIRRQIRRNGKPWQQPFEALTGFKWYGGFGTEIRPLFDSSCPTELNYEGRTEVRGRRVVEYRFHSPADGCFAWFYFEYQRYNPERSGHVYLEASSGSLMELDEDATGFPSEFEFARRQERESWDYVRVGDATHLLPISAEFVVQYSGGASWKIEVTYRNHRHFEASTTIKYQ